MAIPAAFNGRLRLPAIAAPMFLTSGPDLVVEVCRSGLIGTFPALNQRTSEGYVEWLEQIAARLSEHLAAGADHVAIQVLGGEDELLSTLEELAGPLTA